MKFLNWAALAAICVSGTAFAQDKSTSDIVVTGTRLSDTKRALEECIKRHCPPEEDINASLAHAENLFVAGEYRDARQTLKSSLGRNARYAKSYPVPVSDLYRANSRVAAHLGEGKDYRDSTWGIKRALKAGLPKDDPRLVGADLEVADMQASLRKFDFARNSYERIEKEALEINRPDLASRARLHLAWLDQLEGYPDEARRKLDAIAADRGAANRISRLAALVLLARMDRIQGKTDSSDALIAELKGAHLAKSALLFSPPVELHNSSRYVGDSGSVTRLVATDNFDDRWVDIGFWVKPDGHVSDVEILRSSGPSDWTKPLIESIEGRLYSPTTGEDGSYRVERYTYTSLYDTFTGSRIRAHSADARIEFLDLTADDSSK